MAVRALIVDDEPLARLRIRDLLESEPRIAVVGEASDGNEAVAAIRSLRPDLVFLDVQMPELDGFGVVSAIGADEMPVLIFVTAFDQYALQAFEVHAVDYLLKPFDAERFRGAIDHAIEWIGRVGGEWTGRLRGLLQELKQEKRYWDRILVRSKGRLVSLKMENIEWIEAAGNYAVLHMGAEEYLVRETMAALELKLDPRQFTRTHRSTIVRLDAVKEVHSQFQGEYTIVLKNGSTLTLSRTYREKFGELFGGAL